VEYNFNRSHQSLGYLAQWSIFKKELAEVGSPALTMWSATTNSCVKLIE